jgi:hypothetical protein
MEIQLGSFILGMSLVLVIAMAAVSVYAIIKVVKLKNDYNGHCMWSAQEFERIRKQISDNHDEAFRAIDETNKSIDSRSDKLYDKVMKERSAVVKLMKDNDEDVDWKNRVLEIMNKEVVKGPK